MNRGRFSPSGNLVWVEDGLLSRKSKYGVVRTVCDGGNTECYGNNLGTLWQDSDPRLRDGKEEVGAVHIAVVQKHWLWTQAQLSSNPDFYPFLVG